jgi:hypothetical protein
MAKGDTSQHWDSVLVALSRQNPVAASGLVDRIRKLPRQTPPQQARLLLEDGLRLSASDSARAARRLQEAVTFGGKTPTAGEASLALIRLDLTRAARLEDLRPLLASLKSIGARFTGVAGEAAQLSSILSLVQNAADSATPETAQGDLRLFLAAETARDSLQAPRLARTLWRRILDTWPDSPYAPKAILAAQQLDSTWADSARALLQERYPNSPYLAMIRGEDPPDYRQLEDSLGAYAAALAASRAGAVRRPVRDDVPSRPVRRQPTAGGARVPVPR